MTTLDVLYAARERLRGDARFDFGAWESCTCGHIYAAAHGEKAKNSMGVIYPEGPYRDALRAITRAEGVQLSENPAYTVSDLTAIVPDSLRRGRALRLIEKAIKMLEEEQEQARLDVLAQAQEVIEAVPEEPPSEEEEQEGEQPENLVLA